MEALQWTVDAFNLSFAVLLTGRFGIALLVATFSANRATDSPANFSAGFVVAMTVAAALSLLGAVAGACRCVIASRHRRCRGVPDIK
jgi:TctA family transporter